MARSDAPDYLFRDRYPERDATYASYDAASVQARANLPCRLSLPYADHPDARFDLFEGPPGAPLVLFFHGGYWQGLARSRFSFVALPLAALGVSVAIAGYPLAPDALPARITALTGACLGAVVARLSATPVAWISAGHSAGGQLAAMVARGAATVPLAGICAISGIFDLRPLVGTGLNRALRLTVAEAAKISPSLVSPPSCAVALLIGEDETPGFHGQSAKYAAHLRAHGRQVTFVVLPHRNHYTVLLDCLERQSAIAAAIAELAFRPKRG